MTKADVEPARDGIGKMNESTQVDDHPDPVVEKKIEKESDVNSAQEESLKTNGAGGKDEKPNEDVKPASERSLKTNGSAAPDYSGPEVVLGKKTEEEDGAKIGEEGIEGKQEKEGGGLLSFDVGRTKLQEPSDTRDQGENVAQSDELKVNGIVEVKIPEETMRSEAKDVGDIPEDAKTLEAKDVKKVEDTEMANTEDGKVIEAADVEKPEDDSMVKIEDVQTAEAEDTKASEANPKIADVDKPEDTTDDMAKVKAGQNTSSSGARDSEITEPEDAKIAEAEDTERSECKERDDNLAEASQISDAAVTNTSEGKDVDKALAQDVDMSDADRIEDVKIAENEDLKTRDSGDVKLVELNDAKAPQIEEIKDRKEKQGKVSAAEVADKAEDRDETMIKAEDVENSGTKHVQDLTKSLPSESGSTKTLESKDVNSVEAEEKPEVEETDDKEEVMVGTPENNGKALDIESTREEEATKKSQDDKVLESEHLKDTESPESDDKEIVELREEDVKTPGSEGIRDKGESEEGEDEEEGGKQNYEEGSGKARGSKKKRFRGQGSENKDEENEKKDSRRKQKEVIGSPGLSSSERPARERKTVERLVEVLEKEQEQAKKFKIEKGRGTPLKDIPGVARKIARKKPTDLKFLHQTLFGRVGKAVDYKNHILQFSGFTWHETEEKQRSKIKDKLDKCVKDTLLGLCDLFNMPVSRATARKEELVAMLLDFMAAPHLISTDSLDDKEQQSAKSRKRKRVDSKRAKRSKKIAKSGGTRKRKYDSDFESEEDEEEGAKDKGVSSEDEEFKHSENDSEESASGAEAESGDEFSLKSDQKSKVSSKRKRVNDSAEKSTIKSPSKRSASRKKLESDEDNSGGPKVFSRSKKNTDSPKKKSTMPKLDHTEKAPAKRKARSKPGSKKTQESGPSDEDLRKTMQKILKEVDFNTATFTDIFKQLGSHYKTDLAARKASIKVILQEELTKLAEEAEESEDGDEGDSEDDKGRGKRKKIVKV